jgi:hypothetical protein
MAIPPKKTPNKSTWDKLDEMEGFVDINAGEEAVMNCLRTPSPSVNWAFAQPGFGLPYGCGLLLYGPPKGGKSVLVNGIVGQVHQDDPDAYVLKYDSELRFKFQCTPTTMKKFNIDPKRYKGRDTNIPKEIFDSIENDVPAIIQSGTKISAIIIDSLSGIQGRRTLDADTIDTQQRGDHALTIKDGLMRILPVIRRHNIALICTTHVRAEQDTQEAKNNGPTKMHAAWATKHIFEYFAYVEPNFSQPGKVSLAGEEFVDPTVVDFMNKEQKNGRKMRFTIEDSSFPYGGRTAEFTLNYDDGIVNQHEEIFTLAKNYGIIKQGGAWYTIDDKKYNGVVKVVEALRDDRELQHKLLDEVKKIDYKRIKGIKD